MGTSLSVLRADHNLILIRADKEQEFESARNRSVILQKKTLFQLCFDGACELTLMMILIIIDLDDVSSWHLLSPSSLPKARIYYMPVSGHAPLFPLAALVGILVSAPASFAVLFISLCRWKCVWTSFSAHYLPCPW